MTVESTNTTPRRTSLRESSKELQSSIRNLLGGSSSRLLDDESRKEDQEKQLKRRGSLKEMDVAPSTALLKKKQELNTIGSNHTARRRSSSSIVFNQQGMGEKEQFLNIALTRDSLEESWGFSFQRLQAGGTWHLVITKIEKDGILVEQSEEDVKVGDLIWCLNDQDRSHTSMWTMAEVGKVIQASLTLSIRIKKPTLAQRTYVEAKIIKQSKSEMNGFGISHNDDSQLIINTTRPGSAVVKQTELRCGYHILTINDMPTDKMALEEAAEHLKQLNLEIRARKPTLEAKSTITVYLQKPTADTPLGVVLKKTTATGESSEEPRLTNIFHDSPAYHSELEPGLVLEAINDTTDLKGKRIAEVASLLTEAPKGEVVIRARVL